MFFFFFGPEPASEHEYVSLKAKREEIQSQIEILMTSLKSSDDRFRLLSSIYDPKINIIEANNKSMGHRYIGRFTVVDMFQRPHRYTISICKASEFEDKSDERLMKLAKQKALELLKKKHPELFLQKT